MKENAAFFAGRKDETTVLDFAAIDGWNNFLAGCFFFIGRTKGILSTGPDQSLCAPGDKCSSKGRLQTKRGVKPQTS
jgi:hypothetical protein